ncbi:hypothetical protein NDU88_005729 [Pleurodeles waltl]|uniref:Uncharacterized protein n=1 Tax=Pleurodeles waltl TaxID=8319 RepID=A0AAV7L3W2_PLEWA|nr:hypothetical protein NDU88_005729 [Pleurodeles waltl]
MGAPHRHAARRSKVVLIAEIVAVATTVSQQEDCGLIGQLSRSAGRLLPVRESPSIGRAVEGAGEHLLVEKWKDAEMRPFMRAVALVQWSEG